MSKRASRPRRRTAPASICRRCIAFAATISPLTIPPPPRPPIAKRSGLLATRALGAFELQASLRLASLLRAGDRFAEAHKVLGPALKGFLPTPELPAIAEARKLLESLDTEM